ncbi:dienelactone hydrolase family protein [Rhizobium hidalgonense]|uniref:Alpha/beta hydrolase n=1 Tax=Rhizobium hidalgonense TaxID=1538159 RepID=A0A2A6KEU1_9HYPH|nr:dienelactone hydrolase family protein [Rhizobium hidalgonense]MDR9772819.1 dienelactone hydrolase family protein [Rhizobium hidalgonense]MDR9820279.1 dienelactone hydrolase family protein [Rhizobium hidalgonense]PDT23050.1 alpha/beta hydrolase [Rhizobium hidalgonense]PON01293.1 dienelactone hydrolase [Rhizobium hidalgonense]
MRLFFCILVFLAFMFGHAHAASRQQFTVLTPGGSILVESFGSCAKAICPAVLILGGSKGFGAPAYDKIGQTFRAAGLNAYLVHVLSAADLNAIATARGAGARIAFYAQRLPEWTSAVQGVATYLEEQPRHGGKVGVLGISLGAQIASAATVGRADIDALVLVDGGFPNGYSQPVRSLPPLLLIWGSADRMFPLSIGWELQQTAQRLGGSVALDVYEGAHDFFLGSASPNAEAARQNAADFLALSLSQ